MTLPVHDLGDGERLTYGSVCSGIEAASVAWHPLGWRASFLSEIEPFPRAVLKHHYPETPLHGDFTTIEAGQYEPIDLLVGGTPCQSFSVAGLRGGLADDRGNLALEYLRLAQRLRPRWLVWENVPGVLSSAGGRDFGSILGGMVELGYGIAYRVLDAQFFGVAQRRRRVFVVGYAGDWRRAAAVLFERHGLSGHPAPRRATPEGTAYSPGFGPDGFGERARRSQDGGPEAQAFGGGGHCNPTDVATAVSAHPGGRFDLDCETFVAGTLNANGKAAGSATQQDAESGLLVTHALRGEGFDASEDGTGRGTPIVPVSFTGGASECLALENCAHPVTGRHGDPGMVATPVMTLAIRGRDGAPHLEVRDDGTANAILTPNGGRAGIGVGAVAFDLAQITSAANRARVEPELPASTLNAKGDMHVAGAMAVRRLTPRECERLQGFPDDYTLIPWRNGMAPDGPRYKALGNSMAVPCMSWIGRRIAAVEALSRQSPSYPRRAG